MLFSHTIFYLQRPLSMKNILLIIVFAVGTITTSYSQKYAYIDSKKILADIPAYKEAQRQLDVLSEKWQKEIEEKRAEVAKLYKAYQAEHILLPEEMKVKRQKEIEAKEREAMDLQKKKFGVNGELFAKRQELIKPIQDKIFNAVQTIATEKSYAFVFDKSSQSNIMFADKKYDISDKVLNKVKN
jgi:outer membrane protein